MPRFGRVLSAMVTPFDENGALDLDAVKQVARYLQDNGNDGLVVAGTTGEAPVLTDDERLSLFAAVIEAVTIPVIAGSGTNDTAHSVHLTKEAAALGAAGTLGLCPYYNRPSQAGIEMHLRAMAGASDLPMMVYDIPIRTGRKILTSTLLRLFREVPNIVALKDAAGNPGETASLISSVPDGVEVYSGDDVMTLPLMAAGIVGTVGVATHWTGDDHQQMFDLWDKGDTVGARLVNSLIRDPHQGRRSIMTITRTPSEHLLDAYRTRHRELRASTAALLAATVEIYEGCDEGLSTIDDFVVAIRHALRRHHETEAVELQSVLAGHDLLDGAAETTRRIAALAGAIDAARDRATQWNVLARAVSEAAALHDHVVAHAERAEEAIAVRTHVGTRAHHRPHVGGRHEVPLMVRILRKYCWTPTHDREAGSTC